MTEPLTLLHSERPKLFAILAFLSAIGLDSRGNTGCVLYSREYMSLKLYQYGSFFNHNTVSSLYNGTHYNSKILYNVIFDRHEMALLF